jgi:phenylacetic acid degradation operon negative regulatory protein
MMQERKSDGAAVAPDPTGPEAAPASSTRPLTARSVVASTLLGMSPPRLPTLLLVRSGELFGISAGTTRVALSRMVAAGELEPDEGGYRLAGRLLVRQARQSASRRAAVRPWDGLWSMAVVVDRRRTAPERSELREAMRVLRLAETREGVWLRPDNLDGGHAPDAERVVDGQCRRFSSRPIDEVPAEVAARLWDLDGWADRAHALRAAMDRLVGRLEAGDTDALAPGFVTSASVLRHFLADPLLPAELVPPGWPGHALRADYDRYDHAFKTVWSEWFRRQDPAVRTPAR